MPFFSNAIGLIATLSISFKQSGLGTVGIEGFSVVCTAVVTGASVVVGADVSTGFVDTVLAKVVVSSVFGTVFGVVIGIESGRVVPSVKGFVTSSPPQATKSKRQREKMVMLNKNFFI